MLPQFGFIVAQAGADYYSTLPPPPLPSTTNATQSNNNHIHSPALAPLLNTLRSGTTGSSGHYMNSPPPNSLYSRQASPASQPLLPPPSSLYHKDILYQPPPFPSLMDQQKKKDWLHSKPSHPKPMLKFDYKPVPIMDEQVPEEEEEQEDEVSTVVDKESFVHRHSVTARQEYADMMTWMDHEFWEQTDELYQDKLLSLQHELLLLQKGTHTVFEQMIADYEIKREKSIQQAECFMKYQIAFIEHYFDQDLSALEDEYEAERKHLQDTLITSIEDKRKQIKDDRYDDTHEEDTDANSKHRGKRTLRKRAADTYTSRNEPLSKRRQVRPSTLHNIHAISPLEDEELENEFLCMKKLATSSGVTTNKLIPR